MLGLSVSRDVLVSFIGIDLTRNIAHDEKFPGLEQSTKCLIVQTISTCHSIITVVSSSKSKRLYTPIPSAI